MYITNLKAWFFKCLKRPFYGAVSRILITCKNWDYVRQYKTNLIKNNTIFANIGLSLLEGNYKSNYWEWYYEYIKVTLIKYSFVYKYNTLLLLRIIRHARPIPDHPTWTMAVCLAQPIVHLCRGLYVKESAGNTLLEQGLDDIRDFYLK